jgi:hypothetical protein
MFKLIRSILLWPFKALAFLYIVFVEWGWEPLARFISKLARYRWMAWLERSIRQAPPWLALVLFITPTLILLPFKLLALWLIAHGQKLLGIVALILAKIVGTAFVAWLFKLTQPALMQLPWFARIYPRVKLWKDRWVAYVRDSEFWQWAHMLRVSIRKIVKGTLGRMFNK